jgi:hypothetical protein
MSIFFNSYLGNPKDLFSVFFFKSKSIADCTSRVKRTFERIPRWYVGTDNLVIFTYGFFSFLEITDQCIS